MMFRRLSRGVHSALLRSGKASQVNNDNNTDNMINLVSIKDYSKTYLINNKELIDLFHGPEELSPAFSSVQYCLLGPKAPNQDFGFVLFST